MLTVQRYKHPFLFYSLSTIIPWIFWFGAGYLSHHIAGNPFFQKLSGILGVVGLLAPVAVALAFMLPYRALRNDFFSRFFNFRGIKPIYIALTLLLMLASILLAQAISLLFGYSATQFRFAEHYSFTSSVLPVMFILIVAPLVEELAWHSYGTDCLRQRFSLFTTSVIFALFWGVWHFPLSTIEGYYHSNVVESGVIYSLNFLFSLIPFVLIMNWLYYKANRNILVPIVFHITAGLFNEIFATHPMSKVIQTGLLIIVSVVIVLRERSFFFGKEYLS